MGLEQLNFEGKNRVEVAIMRLKEFEPPEGYYLAFSGGKDSITIYNLAVKSGVKFDAHYSQGGIDPPELVKFIKTHYPDMIIERSPMSIFKAIQKRGMPRRQARWCCEMIKEKCGSGRRVVTGIRWEESPRRATRPMFQYCGNADKSKSFLNPIIDWTEKDVWEYIHQENIPHCSLYDEIGENGKPLFPRLGCVLCPMATPRRTQIELNRWPKIAEAWKRACYRYWNIMRKRHPEQECTGAGCYKWDTPEDMWQWWLSRKGEPKVNEAQCIMFDN